MNRSQGERVRLEHSLQRLRAQIDAIEVALRLPGPVGLDIAQGLMEGAGEIAMQIAKHDAYDLFEKEVEKDK